MSPNGAPTPPNLAETFERMLVPAIFEPYARDLVERARPIGASDRILDLGCGTGVVARVLRERLGGAATIVGVDLNPQMIEKARALAPELDFRVGNAMALPFDNDAFDLVLCQQMLQFVPDRSAVLREVRRVLSAGGRLLASTWRPRALQPFHEALGQIAERHLGKSNDRRYALDGAELAGALAEAGFTHVHLDTASSVERFLALPTRLNVMAMGCDLGALSDDERERRFAAIEAESQKVFARFALDEGFGAASLANVATAIAPPRV